MPQVVKLGFGVLLFTALRAVTASVQAFPVHESAPAAVDQEGSDPGLCGAPLSQPEILGTALNALEIPSERALRRDYELSIEADGCNYVFLADRRDLAAVEPIRLVIDRAGKVVNAPACWWLGDLGNCPFPFGGVVLELEPLVPDCTIQRSWAGLADLGEAAWLACQGGQPVLLTHPLNLLGKVHVQSEVEALQFVRFFSSPTTHELFSLNGMLELGAWDEGTSRDLAKVLRDQGTFHTPQVQSQTQNSFCVDRNARQVTCTRTTYTIRRLATFYDGCVYDLTEQVGEDGAYDLVGKELVLEDITRFGFHHEPPAAAPSEPQSMPEPPPVAPPL